MKSLLDENFTAAQPEIAPTEAAHLSQSLRQVATICERAAQGDLEARITGIDPRSEFGALCSSINHMLDMADSFVREAAATMKECSHDRFHRPILLRGLQGGYRQSAATINQAGSKMQESSQRLAVTAQLASDTASSVASVAAACEELNSSNSEISRQAAASATQTDQAVKQVSQVTNTVKELNLATKKIENIVTLINRIAGQTNLLALNATIEAARAGEQGRGFAIVANEVKELARSSAKATEEIGQQIESMRATVGQVMSLIDGVNSGIQELNQGAMTIAYAVKEQVSATNDISRNISQVSARTGEISANMGNAAAQKS